MLCYQVFIMHMFNKCLLFSLPMLDAVVVVVVVVFVIVLLLVVALLDGAGMVLLFDIGIDVAIGVVAATLVDGEL